MRDRFIKPTEHGEHHREIVVGLWILLVDDERFADQLGSSVVAPDLMREKAEKIETVSVGGIAREYLTVQALSLAQVAGLMMTQGLRKQNRAVVSAQGARKCHACTALCGTLGGGAPVPAVHRAPVSEFPSLKNNGANLRPRPRACGSF